MNTIEIGKKSFLIPSNWEELTQKQAVVCANARDSPEGRLAILLVLAGFRLRFWLRLLSKEQLYEAAFELSKFVFRPLTTQKIPIIKVGKAVLKGVQSDLADLKFIEFIKAESLLGGDFKSATDALCGLLYRFEDEKAFDDGLWKEKTLLFQRVEDSLKSTIARFYIDNREVIVKKYAKTIFKPATPAKNGKKSGGSGWGSVFQSMLENPSDVEKLAETNLHSVLIFLSSRK